MALSCAASHATKWRMVAPSRAKAPLSPAARAFTPLPLPLPPPLLPPPACAPAAAAAVATAAEPAMLPVVLLSSPRSRSASVALGVRDGGQLGRTEGSGAARTWQQHSRRRLPCCLAEQRQQQLRVAPPCAAAFAAAAAGEG